MHRLIALRTYFREYFKHDEAFFAFDFENFLFPISAIELLLVLVLRNKIWFVAWVHVEYRFDNSPSDYCIAISFPIAFLTISFRFSLSVALLVTVLVFLFQHLLPLFITENTDKKYIFFY